MARRFDRGKQIRSKWTKTPNGYLLVDEAFPTRTGVLTYYRNGRHVRELRPPEEMVKALDQIARAPITNDHRPANPEDLGHFEGLLGSEVVLQDDGWVRTSAQVMVANAIKDIESKRRQQLSGGFDKVRFEETPGEWDPISQTYRLEGMEPPESFVAARAEAFDGVQRDLQFSHAKLCTASRAGAGARISYDDLDEDDGVEVEEAPRHARNDTKEKAMPVRIKIDGIDYEVDESVAKAIRDADRARHDELKGVESERDTLQEKIQSLEVERDTFKGQVVALEAQRHDEPDHTALTTRLKVLATARKVGVDYLKDKPLDCTKTDAQIMKDAVAKRYDTIDVAEVSDGEIIGMFKVLQAQEPPRYDDLLETAKKSQESGGSGESRSDESDLEAAYDEFCKKLDTSNFPVSGVTVQ